MSLAYVGGNWSSSNARVFFLLFVLMATSLPSVVSADVPRIAVLRFETQSTIIGKQLDQLTIKFNKRLTATGKFNAIPQEEVRDRHQQLMAELKTNDSLIIAPVLGTRVQADLVVLPCVAYKNGFFSVSISVHKISTFEQSIGYRLDGHGDIEDLYAAIEKIADLVRADPVLSSAVDGSSTLAGALLGAWFAKPAPANNMRRREMNALELQYVVEQLQALALGFAYK